MEEWKEYKLGDICSKVCSGGTPSSKRSEYYDGDIPWLNTKEINFNRIYNTEKCITEKGLNNSSAKWIEANSVIVAMYGATAGKSAIAKIPLTTNQACCNLTIDSDVADYRYVYYFLCNKFFELASLANGGAQQNLNAQIIKDFGINMPSLSEQIRIADVLSIIDDKIEVNRRINDNLILKVFQEAILLWTVGMLKNDNLEQQAQALFKSWFVDFEPFKDGEFEESEIGMIPKGWKKKNLGNVCSCLLGGTPSRNKEEYWNGDIAWINSGEINKFRITEPSEYITNEGLRKSATKLLPKKTTVLAITGATLGQVSLLEIDACANQSVIGILENDTMPYEYIFPMIKNRINEICSHMTGGAQQHINKNNVEQLIILVPPDNIIINYKVIVNPIYTLIGNNCFELQRFLSLRDSLLPKLMSGEIKVND